PLSCPLHPRIGPPSSARVDVDPPDADRPPGPPGRVADGSPSMGPVSPETCSSEHAPSDLSSTPSHAIAHPLAALLRPGAARVAARLSGPEAHVPWAILHGDVRDGLAALADDSVACIVTSPPYFWQRDYGVPGQLGHEPRIADYVAV